MKVRVGRRRLDYNLLIIQLKISIMVIIALVFSLKLARHLIWLTINSYLANCLIMVQEVVHEIGLKITYQAENNILL